MFGLLLVAACAHESPGIATAAAPGPDAPFRIGKEDVLDVSVYKDADVSRTLPVRPDGFITLPMAGEIQAEGKTTAQLEEEIAAKLRPYIREPQVTVMVREVNSSKVYVTGEVSKPGAYPLRGRVSVLQALAMAGGLSEFADQNGIVVIRSAGKGGRIPVRYGDLTSSDGSGREVTLMPGDTVVVP